MKKKEKEPSLLSGIREIQNQARRQGFRRRLHEKKKKYCETADARPSFRNWLEESQHQSQALRRRRRRSQVLRGLIYLAGTTSKTNQRYLSGKKKKIPAKGGDAKRPKGGDHKKMCYLKTAIFRSAEGNRRGSEFKIWIAFHRSDLAEFRKDKKLYSKWGSE